MQQQDSMLAEPYRSISDLPFDGDGWFVNADPIQDILILEQPKVAIEVGSWLGLSTRFIAENMTENAKLYAIDTWLGSSDEPIQTEDPRAPYLYQLFLSNIKHANLTQKIIPIRMKSLEAAKALNVQADFIYIDAAHNEESVYQDILAWYAHLNKHGVICGDDWSWDSVQKGVLAAAAMLNLAIFAQDNFWRFYEG
jgi:predicted O-methyltransferase YrrM